MSQEKIKTITINNEEYILKSEVKREVVYPNTAGFVVGQMVFVQTVTFAYTGIVAGSDDKFLVLEEAAWIPSTGRFHQFIKNGDNPEECEPFYAAQCPRISLGAIVTWTPIANISTKVK